jgi:methyl-accepting chemotaxis protein
MAFAFSSLRIRVKLQMVILVPLSALIFFSAMALLDKYNVSNEMQGISRMASLSVQVGGLVHELQKERGLSAGFLASKGTKFATELPAQRQLSDKALAGFREFMTTFPAAQFGPEFKATLDAAVGGLGGVEAKRKEIDALSLETPAAIAFYSQSIARLFDINTGILRQATNSEVQRTIAAYDALLWAKEYAGRERAVLNGAFAADTFAKGVYRSFLSVVSSQSERLDVFKGFASKEQVAAFEKKVTGTDVERLLALRLQAMDNNRLDSIGADPVEWFKVATVRIDLMHEVETSLAKDVLALTAELGGKAARSMYLFATLAVAALLVTIAVGFLVFRSINGPLTEAVDFAEAVAKGNLDHQLGVHQRDEIGQLCASMTVMVASLKEKISEANHQTTLAAQETEHARQATLAAEEAQQAAERAKREGMLEAAGQIESVVRELNNASTDIARQVEASSRGTLVQKDRVTETATAMEEMNATVLEVAQNAGKASESSQSAQQMAQDGATTVRSMVQVIGEVRVQALSLKDNMELLGKSAGNIGQVMGVINDIADQTNLLALNAAIEAARAGDAGRGFAVVADEVRKLAEKTMNATREVSDAIKSIQDATSVNAKSVEQTVTTIAAATELADTSGRSLDQIVGLVEDASDQVRSIAAAAEEQSAASEEINRSITEINAISNETAESMQQSSRAVAELSHQAEALASLVRKMADQAN